MGSSRRSIISSSIGDSPRIDRAISFPILADVAERIPAIRSRSRSPIRPNSSTIDQSNPLAWPADLSADRNSATLPPGPRISPGAGVRRKSSPSRLLASAIARHWPNSSPAFARVTETHPSRCPGRRSGPTSSPKTNNDSPAVLAFFRAVHSSASFTSGCRASARNPLTYSGITIGWPASAMPRRYYQPLRTPRRQQISRIHRENVRRCLRWCQCRRPLFFAPPVPETALAFSVAYRGRRWMLVWHGVTPVWGGVTAF